MGFSVSQRIHKMPAIDGDHSTDHEAGGIQLERKVSPICSRQFSSVMNRICGL
jgi:hypothetical protein